MFGFTFEGLSCSLLLYSQWYQKFMVPKEKIQLTLVNPSIFLKCRQLGAYCSFSKIFSTNIGWIEICEVWCRHLCPSLHELPQPCPLVPLSTVEFVQNSDVAMSNGEIIENAGHLHVSIVGILTCCELLSVVLTLKCQMLDFTAHLADNRAFLASAASHTISNPTKHQ